MRLKQTRDAGAMRKSPEAFARSVLDACADCDTCRFQMDEACLFFPELFRLYDREKDGGHPIGHADLRGIVELCTQCGMCPCPNIRADLVRAKTGYVRREGLSLSSRLLSNIQLVGRVAGIFPRMLNAALAFRPANWAMKRIARVHPRRRMPRIPNESFFAWAGRRGLDDVHIPAPAVAYFAGCTAGYLFPQVAKATVAVLEHNGIPVIVPAQQCCGMPFLTEGDDAAALRCARSNLEQLLLSLKAGHQLVCSCPTCGYLMKILLKERAYYSEAYQRSVGAGRDEIRIPAPHKGGRGLVSLHRSIYGKILQDDGYFAGLDALGRITLAESILDMGEYLTGLHNTGRMNTRFGRVAGRMVYFAPCHQREQRIGIPYERLLDMVPGLSIQRVGDALDCCGMGGSLGFKDSFHSRSIDMGRPLMRKIQAIAPDAIVTDCLSCRLQFEDLLPYPVFHPLEILARAYEAAGVGQDGRGGGRVRVRQSAR